ncbi:MAG: polysaccharide biosynthesis C-terminal domain-containing protein [Cyanobium sp. MAG06]|nr:polysaccharide biosynthesis C-terminal domain-containing protein [Cyanobium sp. MAG06]
MLKYEGNNQIQYLLKYAKIRGLIGIALGSIGLLVSYLFFPKDIFILSLVTILPMIASAPFAIFATYLQIHKKAKLLAILGLIQALILFIIKMILVYIKAPLLYFVFINTLEILSYILFYYLIKNKYFNIRDIIETKIDYTYFKSIFIISIPSIIFIFCNYFIFRVDQIYLYITTNAETVGLYAGAVKIVELSNIFLGVLMSSVSPYIAHNYKSNNQLDTYSKNKEKLLLKVFILSAVIMTLFVMLFTPYIINILYGNRFENSIPILFYYAITIMPAFIMNYYNGIYPARGKNLSISIIYILACIINIIFIYLLYPLLGVIGVAIATVIAYIFAAITLYYRAR